jgi:hypothetical protein
VQQIELELAVGEAVRIGDRWLTVVELDGEEVLFRLSDADGDLFDDEFSYDLRPR